MAIPVTPTRIGIDVSKDELVVCIDPDQPLLTLENSPHAIRQWLASLPQGPIEIAVEATNTFHIDLVDLAHRRGHTLFLIDGFRLSRYRDSVGIRAKTDSCDARLLQRYLSHERKQLLPWTPPCREYTVLQRLIRRRAVLVKARTTLKQSFKGLPELKRSCDAVIRQLERLDLLIINRLQQTLKSAQWDDDAQRCQAIEGVGPITSASLATAFHRGPFKSADAFVAFHGLDVRVRDSGKLKGRRKLSKKGDPELRRLLYLAAKTASRSESWKPLYQRYLDRGLSKIQSLVILARKIARIAFSLMKNQSTYQPKTLNIA